MVQPARFHQPGRPVYGGSATPVPMPKGFTPSAEPMRPPVGYMPAQPLPYRGSAEPMMMPPMSMMPPMMAGSAEPMMPYGGPLPPMAGPPLPPKVELGGVGIVIMDQVDQRGVNEVVVKKVYPNGPAERTGKIKAGDVLSDVNGEDVYMRSSKEIHRLIPGKVGSTVILGFRSADNPAEYYEVECVREMTRLGEMSLEQISHDERPKEGTAEPGMGDESFEVKPIGPQAAPGFSLQKDEDLAGVFIVANVTPGSNAEQCGFQHGEIMEAIDNVPVEGWSERRILKMLTGPYRTLVQVHTNMRVVPVVRDCRSVFDPPRPPPPPPMEQIVPIERYIVTEKLVPVERPMMMAAPQPQPLVVGTAPAGPIMRPMGISQGPVVMGGIPQAPGPIIVGGPPMGGPPMPASVPPMMQPLLPFQGLPATPGPPAAPPPPQAPPSGNYFGGGPPSPPQTVGGFPGVYNTYDGNDGFL